MKRNLLQLSEWHYTEFCIPDIPRRCISSQWRGMLFQHSDITRGFHSAFHILSAASSQSHPYLEARGRESQLMTQRPRLPMGIHSTSVFSARMCPCVFVGLSHAPQHGTLIESPNGISEITRDI